MKAYFTLNNRRYEAKDFTFNTICDLSDMGVDLANIQKSPVSAIRAYVSICMDVDKETAGNELQAHIIEGGSLEEISDAMMKKLNESDFFLALNKTAEETPTPQKKAKEESKK